MKIILLIPAVYLLTTLSAHAGNCKINFKIKNISPYGVSVKAQHSADGRLLKETAFKRKGFLWRAVGKAQWEPAADGAYGQVIDLPPNQIVGGTLKAPAKCKRKRRYRVMYRCHNGTQGVYTKYYPSASGWTKKQSVTVNIGNECLNQ